MLQRHCCLNNAPTKLMRGGYVALCIYQFSLFISDKNKHEVSDQTYNCPHNRDRTKFNKFWDRSRRRKSATAQPKGPETKQDVDASLHWSDMWTYQLPFSDVKPVCISNSI